MRSVRVIRWGDEMWTERQGQALLTFADLILRIYRDSRLRAEDVTPAGLKLALGQGAVLVSQAPQARELVILIGDPPNARVVVTGTGGGPPGGAPGAGPAVVQPRVFATATATGTALTSTLSFAPSGGASYGIVSLSASDGSSTTVVHVSNGELEFSMVSATEPISHPIRVGPGLWGWLPSGGAGSSASVPTLVTYAELQSLIRDEDTWDLIRNLQLDAACQSAARLPLAGAQPVTCSLPSLTLATPIIAGANATLNGQAGPGCSAAQISCLAWEWGDGASDVQAFPARHTFAAPGAYTVTVKTYDSLRQSVSKQVALTIRGPTPTPIPLSNLVAQVSAPAQVNCQIGSSEIYMGSYDISITGAQVRVTNNGRATARNFTVSIYLSQDAKISSADKKIGGATIAALGPGAATTVPLQGPIVLPKMQVGAEGDFWVGAIVDESRRVGESNEGDNIAVAHTHTFCCPAPFLSVVKPTYPAALQVSINGELSARSCPKTTLTRLVWDWGDGAKSETKTFPGVHKYAKPGNHSVKVTAFTSTGQQAAQQVSVTVGGGATPTPTRTWTPTRTATPKTPTRTPTKPPATKPPVIP